LDADLRVVDLVADRPREELVDRLRCSVLEQLDGQRGEPRGHAQLESPALLPDGRESSAVLGGGRLDLGVPDVLERARVTRGALPPGRGAAASGYCRHPRFLPLGAPSDKAGPGNVAQYTTLPAYRLGRPPSRQAARRVFCAKTHPPLAA